VSARRPAALLLSPHPDDELLGCPAHLFALRDAGWRIVDVALTLGTDEAQRDRRRAELEEACSRAGFELVVPGADLLSGDGTGAVRALASAYGVRVLVAPSPHDDHPAHARAGRLAIAAAREGAAPLLWLWALWADLGLPTSLCVFDARRLTEIEHALAAHIGELGRNDYRRLLRARADGGAILLPERVFGYGSPGIPPGSFAEAVCEVVVGPGGELLLAEPSLLEPRAFPQAVTAGADASVWLDGPSPRARLAAAQAASRTS
jgi:LmbE family N-acetylglucosaminyl deacetylase